MIKVRNICLDIDDDNEKALMRKVSNVLNIKEKNIKKMIINKKSLDARKSSKIHFVYELYLDLTNEDEVLRKNSKIAAKVLKEEYCFNGYGEKKLKNRPVIIGSGPAGLFCAYLLAQRGYNPLIIERGEQLEDRIKSVEKFWETNELNLSSNVQFGEGGAGTFSDGKLNTLVKDKAFRMKKVFEIFVECGAPKEIMYEKNPHIGTDVLRIVVRNMRNKIIEMGGEFRFNTLFKNFVCEGGSIKNIILDDNETINCDILVLAIGHSARDTFEMLYKNKINMSNKPFAVGLRIIHSQSLIDDNQYKNAKGKLKPASYKLTYTTKNKRGVYSFCMCPGGYVVNASSENKKLVVNGMSDYRRDSGYANSAIVVTVTNKDYGDSPLGGMKFQRKLEEKAYEIGGGYIPAQTFNAYKENKIEEVLLGNGIKGLYKSANLNEIFSDEINDSLKEGIEYFDSKIKNFAKSNPILLGVESRTSSPVRICRDERFESNIKGIYPCGEGAGYAGGITTSAMDGIKVFEAIASSYKN